MKPCRPAIALALALALGGCVPTTPQLDAESGYATRSLLAQQVRNPEASEANAGRPVDGVDGRAARESMDRYYKSFGEPPKTYNVLTIGVAGGQGGGR